MVRIKGRAIPIIFEKITIATIVKPTTNPTSVPPRAVPRNTPANPNTKPKKIPTNSSLINTLPQSAIFTSPVTKARTTMVADCDPVLPPVSISKGIKNAKVENVLDFEGEKFDTILLLMNGTGIFGQLKNCNKYLSKLKSLLNPGGQILIDSSDIIYMFDEDEDGGKWIPSENDYYGELVFNISYKGEKEESFDWLYLDYNTLQNAAVANGLNCELVLEGEHYDYLAKLSI